ncbi:AAA family ATPase [Helicobacter kayseriensis]|uniref:AAA family ATPase n=1 Tax=Helicobacter kayseriensis TaxID=2905877 RepID=UPI001E32BDE7|nr:AAA family ATPase [Helicobacter kayseriensis]MCE3046542.1 ATP-binding protein [Helicobacter kayseriensis]MCE3048156.1 ATP-binding protein [Helicobacter kayseriensis]
MYLKFIGIKNIGAIEELKIEPSFTDEGNPKPIVIVGENGTGKTILLSSIMDSFYEIGSHIFDNIAKRENVGKHLYKIKGVSNLRTGTSGGFALIQYHSFLLQDKLEYIDIINTAKEEILEMKNDFSVFPLSDSKETGYRTSLTDNYEYPLLTPEKRKQLQKEWYQQAHYYQPAYRYEEPFWKNPAFFERFEDFKKSNDDHYYKDIEELTSLDKNRSFIMDVVLDHELTQNKQGNRDEAIWNGINSILREIKGDSEVRFGIGSRTSGVRVGIARENSEGKSESYLPNISYLSLGESILLNFFINILRHTDQSNEHPTDARGIVVIDEVDTHLHSNLQSKVLPSLIKIFPKIQFILTTHSPLFVLGMKKEFGDEGFDLIEMPTGVKITAERFREFEKAYSVLTKTKKFEDDLKEKIKIMSKPKVFVEGKTDVQYIKRALKLYGKESLLQDLDIEQIGHEDKNGAKNSNDQALKGAKMFLESNPEFLSQKVLILHDPETEKVNCGSFGKDGKLYVSQMKFHKENPVEKGIENLFPLKLIEKCYKDQDRNTERFLSRTIRDDEAPKWKIKDKQKMCNQVCKIGTKEDFKNFKVIVEILEEFLQDTDSKNGEFK